MIIGIHQRHYYRGPVKGRAYDGDPAACWTLHEVAKRILVLLAPVAPLISHYLGSRVYDLDIHHTTLPEPLGFEHDPARRQAILDFNGHVWKAKKEAGLSLAAPIDGIEVPGALADMADVFAAMDKLRAVAEAA